MAEQAEALLSWEFPEFQKHDRSKRWWGIAIGIVAVLVIFSLFTANFLFALILIMITTIVVYQHFHEPDTVHFGIYADGLRVDEKQYRWSELSSFWMVYEPPHTQSIYLTFASRIHPTMMIPFPDDVDPIEVRDVLGEFVEEDLEKETETTSDAIGKWLKL